jgi:hypothetical protein
MITNPYPVNGLVVTNVIPDTDGQVGRLNFPLAVANNELLVHGQKRILISESHWRPTEYAVERLLPANLPIGPISLLFDINLMYETTLNCIVYITWDDTDLFQETIGAETEDGERANYRLARLLGPISIDTYGLHSFGWRIARPPLEANLLRQDVNIYACYGQWGKDIPEYQN